ncbi:MAG: hypothetical protein R3176_08915 [Woeseiaceae bacterium]|nr:hypothetical protein [Woeseiaceae bacterium]
MNNGMCTNSGKTPATTIAGRGARRFWQALVAGLLAVCMAGPVFAGAREQAFQIHQRIAGVPPSDTVLAQMENLIVTNGTDPACPGGVTGANCAAYLAMDNVGFYNVTLKNFAAPWTNRDRSVFVPFNDYIATVVGMIRDSDLMPFTDLLWEDITYVGAPGAASTPAAADNNQHYEELERNNVNLRDQLVRTTQSSVLGIPPGATAGVMTSRAASEAFFIAGTNRAMFRFTLLNHMCYDLEQLHDTKLPPDWIRQDVARSPGGDSRLFLNNCIGCHSGMDPLAGAFAYYNYDEASGRLVYDASAPHPKYFNNDLNFPQGFRTVDDSWENRWRVGQNAFLDFSGATAGSGNGAKSLGRELALSGAFASCQVKKVFEAVCVRPPESDTDHAAVASITNTFRTTGHSMKQVFADTAVHCMGQ